jgi:hypothetical protein
MEPVLKQHMHRVRYPALLRHRLGRLQGEGDTAAVAAAGWAHSAATWSDQGCLANPSAVGCSLACFQLDTCYAPTPDSSSTSCWMLVSLRHRPGCKSHLDSYKHVLWLNLAFFEALTRLHRRGDMQAGSITKATRGEAQM